MVGELFSLKSSFTKRRTTEDFPTAASPAQDAANKGGYQLAVLGSVGISSFGEVVVGATVDQEVRYDDAHASRMQKGNHRPCIVVRSCVEDGDSPRRTSLTWMGFDVSAMMVSRSACR